MGCRAELRTPSRDAHLTTGGRFPTVSCQKQLEGSYVELTVCEQRDDGRLMMTCGEASVALPEADFSKDGKDVQLDLILVKLQDGALEHCRRPTS